MIPDLWTVAALWVGRCLVLAAGASGVLVQAEPLSVRNHNPLNAPIAPPAALGGALLPAGQWRVDLHAALANHFSDSGSAAGNRVRLDGETLAVRWQGRRAVGERFEVGIEIPWLQHSGGVLDGFLNGYHNTLGLPGSGRNRSADGNLLFELADSSGRTSRVDHRERHLGDVTLGTAMRLGSSADRQVALRGAVTLPTGDAGSLTGSGGAGVGAALEVSDDRLLRAARMQWHVRFGVAAHAGTNLVSSDQPLDVFGTLAVGWRPVERLQLTAQFDAHAARYDNNLRETGNWAALGTLGGHLRIWKHLYWSLAVIEDLRTDVAPDVVLQTSLAWRAGGAGR